MNLTVQTITQSAFFGLNADGLIKIIGNYWDEAEALRVSEKKKPSVILLDYEMEKTNTDIFIKSLLIESPDSKVILVGKNLSDEIVLNCLVSGLYGYLDWIDTKKFLNKAIHSVACGEAWVSRRLVGFLIGMLRG